MRKEEGATLAATPTFPHSGQLRLSSVGQDGQKTETSPNHWERLIKYLKCPKRYETPTSDFRLFRIQLIGPPKQTKQMKQNKMQMSLRTD